MGNIYGKYINGEISWGDAYMTVSNEWSKASSASITDQNVIDYWYNQVVELALEAAGEKMKSLGYVDDLEQCVFYKP